MRAQDRAQEAEQASVAFHLALTKIGADTVEQSLALWNEMPPTPKPEITARWLASAIHLIMTRRNLSKQLALSYYRLVRALRTGRTIPDPNRPEPTSVTLAELRHEFAALAGPVPASPPDKENEAGSQSSSHDGSGSSASDDDVIPIDPVDGLDGIEGILDRGAQQEAGTNLKALGPGTQNRILDDIDETAPANEVDAQRDEAHRKAGARQAAASERIVMDGARSTIWGIADRDHRAIGWVRVSRTGTPCGWCAMLISRGPVYRSRTSATFAGGASGYTDGDKYHDNCHCFAMPVFGFDEYRNSDLFALNRQYAEEWPRVTAGLSGKAAVSAWRRHIRLQHRTHPRAQAA